MHPRKLPGLHLGGGMHSLMALLCTHEAWPPCASPQPPSAQRTVTPAHEHPLLSETPALLRSLPSLAQTGCTSSAPRPGVVLQPPHCALSAHPLEAFMALCVTCVSKPGREAGL